MAPVILKELFEIDDSVPLVGYDSPSGKAFACKNLGEHQGDLMAMICEPSIPMRMDQITALDEFPGAGLVKCIDSGVVNWASSGRRQPVLIFEKPAGSRVFETMDSVITPLTDDQIISGFLTPAVATLREFSARGLTHRNIRPSNLFYSDESARLIMLGECVSAPPGYNQPLIFESLECGLAVETGRGMGTPADDLFALGVTLLSLLIGRNPVPQIDDPYTFMLNRINTGSYLSLIHI